jgi:hypothetical protein
MLLWCDSVVSGEVPSVSMVCWMASTTAWVVQAPLPQWVLSALPVVSALGQGLLTPPEGRAMSSPVWKSAAAVQLLC